MSRRLVAGLVALVVVGGVFAYGLSKQGDVAHIDTKNVKVPPPGFQTYAAAAIKGTTFSGARVLARAAARQAGLHQLLGLVVRPVPARGAAAEVVHEHARRSRVVRGRRHPVAAQRRVSFARKAGWRYPIVSYQCCDLGDSYGVVAMPTTIVVNGKGQVVDRLIGPQTAARLRAELHALGA